MNWLELGVVTDAETAEAVSELFNRYSPSGAVVELPADCFEGELVEGDSLPPRKSGLASVTVRTYFPLDGSADQVRRRLEEGLWHLAQIVPLPPPAIREVAEEDWANAWKKHYHPLAVGQRIMIVPAWEEHEPAPGEVTICLEPGMAFGTGLHPTTRQCLAALEAHVASGDSVLDVGTGSGVLAIAAAKLGARQVLALDTDPVAVQVAWENVARNGVGDRVTVRLGSLPGGGVGGSVPRCDIPSPRRGGGRSTPERMHLEEGLYDLVVVNILASVIAGLAPALAARLGPGGRLIAAGLIDSQEEDVVRALRAEGLHMESRHQEGDWVCLVARSPRCEDRQG